MVVVVVVVMVLVLVIKIPVQSPILDVLFQIPSSDGHGRDDLEYDSQSTRQSLESLAAGSGHTPWHGSQPHSTTDNYLSSSSS